MNNVIKKLNDKNIQRKLFFNKQPIKCEIKALIKLKTTCCKSLLFIGDLQIDIFIYLCINQFQFITYV